MIVVYINLKTSSHVIYYCISRNMFDFKHIQPFEKSYADREGPMVVFATPGMLHAGMSLDVFKKWAGDERNMVILPGYCVAGTVGAKVLAGQKIVRERKKKFYFTLRK